MPEDFDKRFDYHAPTEAAREAHEAIRTAIKNCAATVFRACPDCREKSLAMTKLEEVLFWSNAAIARNHDKLPYFPGPQDPPRGPRPDVV